MIRFVVFLLLLAVVLYGVFWAIDRRNSGGTGPSRPLPRGPVGPDDDESFLRDLERKRRRNDSTDRNPPDRPDTPGDT